MDAITFSRLASWAFTIILLVLMWTGHAWALYLTVTLIAVEIEFHDLTISALTAAAKMTVETLRKGWNL